MTMIRRVTRVAACLALPLVLAPRTAGAGDTAVAKALERHFQESCKADAPGAAVIAVQDASPRR